MSEYLPYKSFEWNNEVWTKEKILELDDKGDTGYLFSVDLHIPKEQHDPPMTSVCCSQARHFCLFHVQILVCGMCSF